MALEKIVCAVDFSDLSVRAAHVASRLAARDKAQLTLLFVDQPAEFSGLGPDFSALVAADLERVKHSQDRFVEANLRKLVSTLRSHYEIETETAMVRARAADGITGYCESNPTDLLVIGHHGAGAHRLLLGSVAARVARRTRVSTLVVPAGAPDDITPGSKVLVAVEIGASTGVEIARAAVTLAAVGAQVEVFNALYEPKLWSLGAAMGIDGEHTWLVDAARDATVSLLSKVVAELDLDPARTDLEIGVSFERGSPAHTVLQRAEAIEADLVAVGAHGRRGVERILGTTAERVLRHSDVPVLLVPVDDAG